MMRIVCLVPSWTESLVEAGANVVGRTRYCVHPRVRAAEPDLLVLDRQENPRSIAEQSPVPWVATEVTSVESAGRELDRLGDRLKQPELSAMAERWRTVCARFARVCPDPGWLELPGVLEWVRDDGEALGVDSEPRELAALGHGDGDDPGSSRQHVAAEQGVE